MHNFTRLMLATLLAVLSIGLAKADEISLNTTYTWKAPATVEYTSSSEGTLTFVITSTQGWDSYLYIYYGVGNYNNNVGVSVPAGKSAEIVVPIGVGTNTFWLSEGNSDYFTYIVKGEGGDTPGGGEGGDKPAQLGSLENPRLLADDNHIVASSGATDIWYKIIVPAGNKMTFSIPGYGGSNFYGYCGIDNAQNKINAIDTQYSFDIWGPAMTYTNTESSEVDFYICQTGNSWGSEGYATIELVSDVSPSDAKSIGALAWSINDNAEVNKGIEGVTLTFPNFVGGNLESYNVELKVTINELTSDGYNAGALSGYYQKKYIGTAEDGVEITFELPQTDGETRYQIIVEEVRVTNGNLTETNLTNNIVSFTAVGKAPAKTYDVTITAAGWAAMYLGFNYNLPEGVDAYYASEVIGGSSLKMTKIEGVVPAYTPVVLNGDQGTYTLTQSEEDATQISGNLFRGSTTAISCTAGDSYVISSDSQKDQLVLAKFMGTSHSAHKVWLPIEYVEPQASKIVVLIDGNATAISGMKLNGNEVMFNLAGQRVSRNAKGVVIVNGKKFTK